MNIKKLNDASKKMSIIRTGYKIYICCDEIWKRGRYNNKKVEYYVSSLGRIYNINRQKFIIPFMNDSGYLYCMSYYIGKRTSIFINRLVAETFLGFPKKINNAQADHINRDKLDNSISNLQWISDLENLNRRILPDQSGKNNSNSKYSKEMILTIAELLSSGRYTMREISETLNIPYTTVSDIKSKTRWVNLIKDYDFSKVPSENKTLKRYDESQIIHVAELLAYSNKSIKEISNITGVSYDMIVLIKNNKAYEKLLVGYDFSNYSGGKNTFTKSQLVIIDDLIRSGYNPKEICEYLNIEYTKKYRNSIYDRKRKLKVRK